MSLAASTSVAQVTKPMRPCQEFEHTSWVEDIIHLPGGQQIMTGSHDGSLQIWSLRTGKQITKWNDKKNAVKALALSPDGKKVVFGTWDGAVRIWNIKTGKVIARWTGHANGVISVCWNRDATRVVSGCTSGTARVWNVGSGKTILEIATGLHDMYAATYSPSSTKIATGGDSENEFIKIWDASTGEPIANLRGHTEGVDCLIWAADGSKLISGSSDHSIRSWNTTTWQQIMVLIGHTGTVYGIAISPNDRILASAAFDGTAQLWNLDNGQPIGSPLQHTDNVNCLSFSTDGQLLATGCWDNNAYTWDIAAMIKEVGLDELLVNSIHCGKSFLDDDATRRPGQQAENARRLQPSFFDDSPHHHESSRTHRQSPPHNRPRLHLMEWARNPFSTWTRRRHDDGLRLQERPPIVDVPLTKKKPMYYSAREIQIKKEKERARDVKNAKSSFAASRPPRNDITQHSAAVGEAQPSEQYTAGSILSTTLAVAATPGPAATASVTSLPNAIISWTGCCTRFNCCAPALDTNDHH